MPVNGTLVAVRPGDGAEVGALRDGPPWSAKGLAAKLGVTTTSVNSALCSNRDVFQGAGVPANVAAESRRALNAAFSCGSNERSSPGAPAGHNNSYRP